MAKSVCVITGGGSGMGLAAAKCMPKDKIIVVTGRTLSKLEGAVKELEALGYEAYAKTCDTSIREQVRELAEYAASLGEIKNVYAAEDINTIDGVKISFEARKEWVHLRRSNTEPIIRIYAEAATQEAADALAQQIIDIAKKIIG